jgi:hypothetical protein
MARTRRIATNGARSAILPCSTEGHPARGDPKRRRRPRLQKALGEAVDAIWPIHKTRGRPRKRPKKKPRANKDHDSPRCRRTLRKRGVPPASSDAGPSESSEMLGRHRWVVERTPSWPNRFRRLKVRYERRDDIHRAFLDLERAPICWHCVQRFCQGH